jgi:hypothetical protein
MLLKMLRQKAAVILGPVTFSISGGHFRSGIGSRPVDAFGNPIPWYTYPAVDFLSAIDFSTCNVAEFGAGNSTLWWAKRARSVLALEADGKWCADIGRKTAGLTNVEVKLVSSPQDAAEHVPCDYFDVMVVDGGTGASPDVGRPFNAQTAFRAVRRNGLVIVDNSNASYCLPAIDAANAEGWLRVDFIGHSAGATKRSCTSLFFRAEVSLLRGLPAPHFRQIVRESSR